MDVTVVGAGVMGLCVAQVLTERGASVTLIDKAGAPGPHGASWWAGGLLTPNWDGDPADDVLAQLGAEATAWWDARTPSVHRKGVLVASLSDDDLTLSRYGKRQAAGGALLSGAELASLEPGLSPRINAALHYTEEAHLTPRCALYHLHLGLEPKITFKTATVDPGAAAAKGLTVDCRGIGAARAFRDMAPVGGEMVMLSAPDVTLARPVRLIGGDVPLSIVPRGDGVFMVGSTMLEGAAEGAIKAGSMLMLLQAACVVDPRFATAEVVEVGVDTRAAFPDHLPRITREGNLIRVNGLHRSGFMIAPALATKIADEIFDTARDTNPHRVPAE